MTPGPGPRYPAHLRALAPALGLALVGALFLAALRWDGASRQAGQPERNLAAALGSRFGLRVSPEEVVLAGGPPPSALGALRYRHVFFLGRARPGAPRDVYWVLARVTPAGVPLGLRTLVNLSQTPKRDESALATRGPLVAFPIASPAGVGAVAVLDVRGDHPRTLEGRTGLRRWTNHITNLQEHGHWRGLGRHSLEPREPTTHVTLRFLSDSRLEAVAQGPGGPRRAVLDCDAARLLEGRDGWVYLPPMKGEKPLFNWLVDTVRNLPFVGPEKIEWLEVKVYSVWDFLKRRRGRGQEPGEGGAQDGDDGVAAVSAVGHEPYRPEPGAQQASGWPPPPIPPLLGKAHPKEGKWVAPPASVIHFNPGAPPPVLETFVHPDPERSYSAVGILIWDPRQVTLGMVAGTKEPESSTGLRGWGLIPRDKDMGRVIAAFNGGFQTMHGDWGMQSGGRLIRDPARWAATVATDRSGDLLFGTWEEGEKQVPPHLFSLRQNLAPMIEDGVVNPLRNLYWGLAVKTDRERIHIVRSGLCLTEEGYGAYLWGQAVSLATLAKAMQMARCQYGMQMDINKTNASLEFYRIAPRSTVKESLPATIARGGRTSWGVVPGSKNWVFHARNWLPAMYTAPFPRYIRQDWRDFMYLSLRPILPGAPLAPLATPAQEGEGQWSTGGLPQGADPFPARLAATFLRTDSGSPPVQLVKLDPRRIRFRAVRRDAESGRLPSDERAIALLGFGAARPKGLQVGAVTVQAPPPQTPALLVEDWREGGAAPAARVGVFGSTPPAQRCLLAVAGVLLGDGGDAAPGQTPGPAPGTSSMRASALGVDAGGHVCYGVTDAGPGAAKRLAQALGQAGCPGALRLPDQALGGPLVLGPTAGRLKLLPGD